MSGKGSKASDLGKDRRRRPDPVPPHQADLESATKHKNNERERVEADWGRRAAKATFVTNILLAIFGFVGSVAIIWQLIELQNSNRETRKANATSLRMAERTLQITQRAYVGLVAFPELQVQADGRKPIVTARIKNTGAVPAKGVRHRLKCELTPIRFPATFQ